MRRKAALTLVEVLIAGAVLAIVLLIVVLVLRGGKHGAHVHAAWERERAWIRQQHQAMVIYSVANNSYLPGLDSRGRAYAAEVEPGVWTPSTGVSTRYWVLLSGGHIEARAILRYVDGHSKSIWTTGRVTADHYSYAMLEIAGDGRESARASEWRDTANSLAVLISDYIGAGLGDSEVQSLWTAGPGDWRGSLVWGDNHSEFVQTASGFTTRYLHVDTTNDSLFADGPTAGSSESGTVRGLNAFMVDD